MKAKAILAGIVTLVTGTVLAAELTEFVPAEDGAAACWQRVYDGEHLAAHPDQQVTAMTLSMSFEKYDAADSGMHYFAVDVALRDGRRGTTAGGCWVYDGAARCGVDCDGGGMELALDGTGNLLADLDAYGYMRVESECGGGEEAETFELLPGIDDKLFLLHRAEAKVCKSLLPSW
ncbi:hypothetical protein [Devosia sp. CAU 1758]